MILLVETSSGKARSKRGRIPLVSARLPAFICIRTGAGKSIILRSDNFTSSEERERKGEREGEREGGERKRKKEREKQAASLYSDPSAFRIVALQRHDSPRRSGLENDGSIHDIE